MMAHNYLELTMEGMGEDDFAISQFGTADGQHVSQISSISELPRLTRNDHLQAINKDHMYGIQLQTYGCVTSNPCLNQPEPTLKATQESQQVFVTGHDQNIQASEFDGELVIEEDPLEALLATGQDIRGNAQEGTEVVNDGVVEVYDNNERDLGVEEVLQLIQSHEGDDGIEFVAVDSDKKRNPPYLIKDLAKITTKNAEPIRFCLQGASVCQVVTVTQRYTEEKFKNNPVTACKLHSKKEYEDFNFELSAFGDPDIHYEKISDHPTAHFPLKANNLDVAGNFNFYTTFRCLNSCHKENGKKMEIIFKLMDPVTRSLIKENRFEVRSCKNVKRDYKEAFQEEVASVEKRVRPESFISQEEEPQVEQPQCSKQEVKCVEKVDPVSVVMIKPGEQQKMPEKSIVECVYTPVVKTPQPEYHLVKLPTMEKQRAAFEVLRLLGADIMKLESVSPIEGNTEQEDAA